MKNQNKIVTFLGKDTVFDGTLKFEGTIRVDGLIKGRIEAPKGTLVVGETARLESNIHVASITISGEVRGDITADRKIDINVPGRVFGNIQAPTVVVQEGVVFAGNCQTLTPGSKKASSPEPETSPQTGNTGVFAP
ncbi:MAG: polymer-forming cytoskeletal protein [Desulfobacterales bacterium]|nr:polymer-forming cytoskeletal protein [Desulfobacterales bacterium]